MKLRSSINLVVLISLLLAALLQNPAVANIYEKPKLISFTFTPNEIDLNRGVGEIGLTLKVSHPIGINDNSVIIRLQKRISDTSTVEISTPISRTDSPTNKSLKEVTFSGKINIPVNTDPGVWNITSDPIKSYFTLGTAGWESDRFEPSDVREMKNARNALLIRLNTDLNFDFQTFVGPLYNSDRYVTDSEPILTVQTSPIFRIGEVIDLSKYFQLRTNDVELNVSSLTPNVCISNGTKLTLLSRGYCEYKVFTPKTNNYIYKELIAGTEIKPPRLKPELYIPSIENIKALGAPKSIPRTPIYYGGNELIFPSAETPSVCLAIGNEIKIFSGGTCKLSYLMEETESRLASNKYFQTFEIIRDPQSINFTPPATANLSAKTLTLSATASSGGVITYQSTSADICSITGSTLNLLKGGNCAITATQAGSATLAPVSAAATVMITGSVAKKTITCVKGNKTKKVSGTNPKCPKGYKVKR